MVAFVEERDIDVEDVTVLQDTSVGYAVADDFVDGCADRLGKVVVVEWRRVGL